jgi:hypothetical protein
MDEQRRFYPDFIFACDNGGITDVRSKKSPVARAPRRTQRRAVSATDPFRPEEGGERPEAEAVVHAVLNNPALMREIVRRLSFVDPELLAAMACLIDTLRGQIRR